MGGITLSAAFAATAGETTSWASRGRSASIIRPIAALPSGTTVAFCYVDGTYAAIPQPPGANIQFTRALVLAPATGNPILYEVGPSARLALLPPPNAQP
jgi:hypothetical protein